VDSPKPSFWHHNGSRKPCSIMEEARARNHSCCPSGPPSSTPPRLEAVMNLLRSGLPIRKTGDRQEIEPTE
jgi:hypothetical protein